MIILKQRSVSAVRPALVEAVSDAAWVLGLQLAARRNFSPGGSTKCEEIAGTCEASKFDSNWPFRFDYTVMGRLENFRIGRVCPLFVVVRRLEPLTALSGTVYRLAISMSDHTPVLFNVFEPENWNEQSVVRYISFVSFVINY